MAPVRPSALECLLILTAYLLGNRNTDNYYLLLEPVFRFGLQIIDDTAR